jgi:uncharacterized protein YigE (DUF2233 family)
MPRLLLLLAAALGPIAGVEGAAHRTPATLSVRGPDGWREWWRADKAPTRWQGPLPAVAGAVMWRPLAPGVQWGELQLSGDAEAWRIRAILVQLDPRQVRLETRLPRREDGRLQRWSVDSAPAEAIVALNTGQFSSSGPWGWLVQSGEERLPPGSGPLAPALVVDSTGTVRMVSPDSIAFLRRDPAIREAFQSYPSLLVGDGEIPRPLREAGLGVDLDHRDARLGLGLDHEGKMVIAITRFEGLGGVLSNLPFGLTTPEMAALMGALGCRRAMLLDGGISSQLLLRPHAGKTRAWRGMRQVPLGLVVLPAIESR